MKKRSTVKKVKKPPTETWRVPSNEGQPLWVLLLGVIGIIGFFYLFAILPSGDTGKHGFFGNLEGKSLTHKR